MNVSESLRQLQPYVPGRSVDEVQRQYGVQEVIKLASNENALGANPKVVAEIQKNASQVFRYPDSSYQKNKKIISHFFDVLPENVCFGNGSDELIDILIRIFCEPNQDAILIPAQSFVAYKVRGHVNRVKVTEIPLLKNLQIDISAMVKALDRQHRIVFLPNPNNPSGRYLSKKEIEPLLQAVSKQENTLLVVDEAYTEFIRADDYPDMIKTFKEMKNLVVLRTLSKAYGLAGLRSGFMLADVEICNWVERVRLPFNSNILSSCVLEVALSDQDFIKKSQGMVWQGLDYFERELKKMGLEFCPSQGNFIFFDTRKDSSLVFDDLLKKGIILRPVKNYGFMTQIRMTVGLPEENKRVIECLKQVL